MIPSISNLLSATFSGLALGALFAVAALGLSLVFGVMRMVNLWHGEMIVLGSYLAFALTRHTGLDPLVTIFIVAPVLFLIAALIFRVLLERPMVKGPEPALITTFALSIIAQNLYILIWSGDTQTLKASYATSSLTIAGVRIPVMYLICLAIAVVLFAAVHLMLQRTSLGRGIRAASEDAEAAGILGVHVRRVHLFVYGLGGACAAVGGVLVGLTYDFTPTTGIVYLLTGFAVVVLGGLGSVKGTFFGAMALGLVESLGASVFGDGYRNLIGFVVFLVVLSLRPHGLFRRAVVS